MINCAVLRILNVGWCCRCHVEMDLAAARCPGEAVLGAENMHKVRLRFSFATLFSLAAWAH